MQSLKCRSGNQQTTNEFKRVIQKCKHRRTDSEKNDNNNSSSDNDTSEEDSSDGSVFGKDFFTNNHKERENSTKYTGNNRPGVKYYRSGGRKRGFAYNPYYSNRSNNTRTGMGMGMGQDHRMNNSYGGGDGRDWRGGIRYDNRRAAGNEYHKKKSV